ncbi:hypothetical protein SBA2_180017 [Acidobacteriia bacterium SbA2]|nr:hypothetical protein SBA2_180017 [Acidobacteriia bacterium SbA2]
MPRSAEVHRQTIRILHEHSQFFDFRLKESESFVDLLCRVVSQIWRCPDSKRAPRPSGRQTLAEGVRYIQTKAVPAPNPSIREVEGGRAHGLAPLCRTRLDPGGVGVGLALVRTSRNAGTASCPPTVGRSSTDWGPAQTYCAGLGLGAQ